MKIQIVKPHGKYNIFIQFVEEFWQMKPKYRDYRIGRVEVTKLDEEYAGEEIRFLTNKIDEFLKFRTKWDFKYITAKRLEWIRTIVDDKFFEHRKEMKNG